MKGRLKRVKANGDMKNAPKSDKGRRTENSSPEGEMQRGQVLGLRVGRHPSSLLPGQLKKLMGEVSSN